MARPPLPRSAVERFLADARANPPAVRTGPPPRILFAMDATASREPTWDLAMNLHAELFHAAAESDRKTNAGRPADPIAVQLVYYRGYDEFHVSPWSTSPAELLGRMTGVACRGGLTRIERVLEHALLETRREAVRAAVFVGDCCEEPAAKVVAAAGRLALFQLPFFVFQEGRDPVAAQVFRDIARITGGAHMPFAPGSAARLRELFGVVARYAAEGRAGVRDLPHATAQAVLAQLPP